MLAAKGIRSKYRARKELIFENLNNLDDVNTNKLLHHGWTQSGKMSFKLGNFEEKGDVWVRNKWPEQEGDGGPAPRIVVTPIGGSGDSWKVIDKEGVEIDGVTKYYPDTPRTEPVKKWLSYRQNRYSVVKNEKPLTKHAWWKTDDDESLKSYVKRNLDGQEKDGEVKFRKGVANMLHHPVKDLDDEWQEYTSIADNDYYGPQGHAEPLSHDRFERNIQRGAALVGRVVSQANIEPLEDKNQNRSFREIALDFEFGRRL
jgi:hypothetical protein